MDMRDPSCQVLVSQASNLIICNSRFLDEAETERVGILDEGSEHWMPQITKFIFENRLGRLAYECQTAEEEKAYAEMDTADVIADIED